MLSPLELDQKHILISLVLNYTPESAFLLNKRYHEIFMQEIHWLESFPTFDFQEFLEHGKYVRKVVFQQNWKEEITSFKLLLKDIIVTCPGLEKFEFKQDPNPINLSTMLPKFDCLTSLSFVRLSHHYKMLNNLPNVKDLHFDKCDVSVPLLNIKSLDCKASNRKELIHITRIFPNIESLKLHHQLQPNAISVLKSMNLFEFKGVGIFPILSSFRKIQCKVFNGKFVDVDAQDLYSFQLLWELKDLNKLMFEKMLLMIQTAEIWTSVSIEDTIVASNRNIPPFDKYFSFNKGGYYLYFDSTSNMGFNNCVHESFLGQYYEKELEDSGWTKSNKLYRNYMDDVERDFEDYGIVPDLEFDRMAGFNYAGAFSNSGLMAMFNTFSPDNRYFENDRWNSAYEDYMMTGDIDADMLDEMTGGYY
eukprot:NODE_473_length_7005_cov_0.742977.p2 type:complete len:419 gc:universal NODE_473_length_7005_cov_0.742977:1848-592(-)